jgi:SAM-dependent methyltransferase
VDGVPVLVRDPAAILTQPPRQADAGVWCEALAAADPTSDMAREAWLLTMYALSHHPEACPSAFVRSSMTDQGALTDHLIRWLRAHGPVAGDALELGCGVAGHAPLWRETCGGSVTLCDLRPGMLSVARDLHAGRAVELPWRRVGRHHVPISVTAEDQSLTDVHYVVGDAIDPPFAAEHFELVVALNLVDTVRDPWMLLGQLDALTAPGGLLLLGQPFHYEAHAQHPDGWFDGPQGLLGALGGELDGLEHLAYDVLEATDNVPWSLPAHDRLVHRYGMHVLLAHKRIDD